MNAEDITECLEHNLNGHKYFASNVYIFRWEADFFCVTKSGYCWEIEIKISKADFKADFKKEQKHLFLSTNPNKLVTIKGRESNWGYEPELVPGDEPDFIKAHSCHVSFVDTKEKTPNRFYYCCPKGMISKEDVPEYAGLIEIVDHGHYLSLEYTKNAPLIHKQKNNHDKALLTKFFFQYQSMKHKLRSVKRELKRIKNKQP